MKKGKLLLVITVLIFAVVYGCKKDDGGDTPNTSGQVSNGDGTINSGGGTGGTDINTDTTGGNSTREVADNGDAAVMVDLGLSVRWADRNIGATVRTDYGSYFAWGETKPKNEYTTDTYVHYQGGYLNIGDNIGETQYDPASANWGDGYRTPTKAEFQELIDNCTWKVTTVDGAIVGYQITSNVEGHTDRSIFLPCTGDYWTAGLNDANTIGRYWTSDCAADGHAYDLAFSAVTGKYGTSSEYRGHGMCVRPVQYIAPTAITLSATKLEIERGSTKTLTATIEPSNASDKTITWKSSDNSVAKVSDDGTVTAVSKGTATITAESVNGKTAECEVSVIIPVTSITLDKTLLTLSVNNDDQKSYTLTATIKPADADNATITWSSSDKTVATVDENGKVTAIDKGTSTITIEVGGKRETCIVTVIKRTPAEVGKVIPVSCATDGKLPGKFSVSSTKKIQFSQGNLQYQASTDTWRFGEAQYSVVGIGQNTDEAKYDFIPGNVSNSDNREISANYSGWIDLFGWGTSGYNDKYPYSTEVSDYYSEGQSIIGTEYDWGVHNAISNGGNHSGLWRVLTEDEWKYLLSNRGRSFFVSFGVAEVSGITGIVILPDEWRIPDGLTFTEGQAQNTSNDAYFYPDYCTLNQYTAEQWQRMEAAGAVFLPAAGGRQGTEVSGIGNGGTYWSASINDDYMDYVFIMDFVSRYNISRYGTRERGHSVRLVSDVE